MGKRKASSPLEEPPGKQRSAKDGKPTMSKVKREATNDDDEKRPLKRSKSTAATTKLDPEQEQFRDQIQEATKRTPKFLFRVWTGQSGGNAQLNTTEVITPLAFMDNSNPLPFYQHSRESLQEIYEGHLRGSTRIKTIFSSWSQSLLMVCSMAAASRNYQDTNIHICILDTKQLGPEQFALHTGVLSHILGMKGLAFGYECLVYGVSKAPAYKAVAFEKMWEAGMGTLYELSPELNHETRVLQEDLDAVIRIAELFGPEFELPVAAFIASRLCTDSSTHQTIVDRLAGYSVPEKWKVDPTLLAGEADGKYMQDAGHGAALLGEVVALRYGSEVLAKMEHMQFGMLPASQPWSEAVEKAYEEASEWFDPIKVQEKAMRKGKLPREVAKLHRDWVGWRGIWASSVASGDV